MIVLLALQQIARYWRQKLDVKGHRDYWQCWQVHNQRVGRRSARATLSHTTQSRKLEQ